MLVTLAEILKKADEGNYGVVAPDYTSMESVRFQLEVAEKFKAPLILSYTKHIRALNPVKSFEKNIVKIEQQVNDLRKELIGLKTLQSQLSTNLENNLTFQQELQQSTAKLIELTKINQTELEPLKIKLLQPSNLYIYALPLVTIFIVLGSTYVSLRTIKIKSQESLDALDNSNKNQFIISKNANESERLKSKEAIISDSRQRWINTLRDDLSSLMSHLTQYSASSKDRKAEIFSNIWTDVYKVQLLLNPNEDMHKELEKEINTAFGLCTDSSTKVEFMAQRDAVLNLSKKILKHEWQRVKNFE